MAIPASRVVVNEVSTLMVAPKDDTLRRREELPQEADEVRRVHEAAIDVICEAHNLCNISTNPNRIRERSRRHVANEG